MTRLLYLETLEVSVNGQRRYVYLLTTHGSLPVARKDLFLCIRYLLEIFSKINILSLRNIVALLPLIDTKYVRFASVLEGELIRIWYPDLGSQETSWNLRNDG